LLERHLIRLIRFFSGSPARGALAGSQSDREKKHGFFQMKKREEQKADE
jgi:hypothetical protein